MSHARRVKVTLAVAIVAMFAMSGGRAYAQASDSGSVAPTNDVPNPYRTVSDWGTLPEGRKWGATSGVAVDAKDHVWVAERCGGGTCAGSNLDPILEFSPEGKLISSFGAGMFVTPHGITVDKAGNIWVTDQVAKDGKGMQVFKFSPTGKVLLTLGKAGVAGDGPDEFNQPSAVAIAPSGDIFVADGHGGNSNARIVKFDKTGKFLMTWGKKGTGPGEFDVPHALAFDSKGRLYVGDRGNSRIQVFDQQGHFIEQLLQFSRPSGIVIAKGDIMYVADSESGGAAPDRKAWKRGIRVGSLKTGTVTALIPDPNTDPNVKATSAAEGVAVDSHGTIYGAEVGPRDIKKYVKQGS